MTSGLCGIAKVIVLNVLKFGTAVESFGSVHIHKRDILCLIPFTFHSFVMRVGTLSL